MSSPEQTFVAAMRLGEDLRQKLEREMLEMEDAVKDAEDGVRAAERTGKLKAIDAAKAALRASKRLDMDAVKKFGILARALADISVASHKVDERKLRALQGKTEEELDRELSEALRAELAKLSPEELARIRDEREGELQ